MARAKRKAVSKRRRFEVFKRDKFTCLYCGQRPPQVVLHLDHIVAVSNGGDNSTPNLATSCEACNQGKSNVPLDQAIPVVQAEIERGQEMLAQLKAMNRLAKAQRQCQDESVKIITRAFVGYEVPLHVEDKIRMFLNHLPVDQILGIVNDVLSRDGIDNIWLYFLKICWNRLQERPFPPPGGSNAS